MTITKRSDGNFLVDTGELLSDLRPWKVVCKLSASALRTVYEKGAILTVPPVRVNLGPAALNLIQTLCEGDSVTL